MQIKLEVVLINLFCFKEYARSTIFLMSLILFLLLLLIHLMLTKSKNLL